MARNEDEQHRLIREDRLRKGKAASTASAPREKVDQNPEVADDEEVPEDVVADYLEVDNLVLEGKPEPQTRRRHRCVPLIPPYQVGGPPFPGGLETT